MTPDQAVEFAARINVAIDRLAVFGPLLHDVNLAADRERVASDLAGLRAHLLDIGTHNAHDGDTCEDIDRYADGLLRTARLYGIDPGASS